MVSDDTFHKYVRLRKNKGTSIISDIFGWKDVLYACTS